MLQLMTLLPKVEHYVLDHCLGAMWDPLKFTLQSAIVYVSEMPPRKGPEASFWKIFTEKILQ